MLIQIILWTIVYCLSTSISVVLVGDRNLISGNLFNIATIFNLLLNWKFILAMSFAILSRISFIFLNNSFLKIPRLAPFATTLTSFVTLISLIFIVLANYLYLNERLNTQQIMGAVIISLGVILMAK